MLGKQFDFFTTTPEDKRITAFQAQYPLALLRKIHQELIDAGLLHAMLTAAFTHVNSFGITPYQLHHSRGHATLIETYTSLLHQAQGAQGEQFRVSVTTAYHIDFPLSEARILCLQGIGYSLVRLRRLPV